MTNKSLNLIRRGKLWVGQFRCMASPCEILIESDDESSARNLCLLGQVEALRIEQKFSRYRDDNVVNQINDGDKPVRVDDEVARLLDFAENCYQLSDGWFDITSGILRTAWDFSKPGNLPANKAIKRLLPFIGWDRVTWQKPWLTVPQNMEIDFGGIGKEYAVDSVSNQLQAETDCSLMVNFGGDCHASGPLSDGSPWLTGIENPNRPGDASAIIQLSKGALATSGDVFRFIEHEGIRYGHILNPETGWPNTESPKSVTVAAATCTEAGVLSTLAMLQGSEAESFLQQQEVRHWCYR